MAELLAKWLNEEVGLSKVSYQADSHSLTSQLFIYLFVCDLLTNLNLESH